MGLVSIVFTDLVDSTSTAVALGDRAADELRRAHFASLREAVAATGGTEVKTIGDSLMVTYEGAAEAVEGAVAMQRAVDRQNRRSQHPLAMRVGLSAGDATFEDGDWFGTPVVEAARLCATAAGGQILTTELLKGLAGARADHEFTAAGERDLKGLPDPVVTYEIGWAGGGEPVTVPLPPLLERSEVFPFAGRRDARRTLETALKEAVAGRLRSVFVSGEPGIGKTRIVAELARGAAAEGAAVLWGRCDPELATPFGPFVEAIGTYVAAVEPGRVAAQLGPLGGELRRIVPDLEHRVPGLGEPVVADAETQRHRLFEAVVDLVSGVSLEMPVVLVLDDLHWADRPTLLMLRHLLRTSVPLSTLVVATYRDTDLDRTHPLAEMLADLRRDSAVERLALGGLAPDEVERFMEQAAGHDLDEPGRELATVLYGETDGNPFFVQEVLLHLAESGAIVEQDGRWVGTVSLDEYGIPEGIREVIGRRLSALSGSANDALSVAAVVGPTFRVATVATAGDFESDQLLDALDEAAAAGLLDEVDGAAGTYSFAHALIRSTLYEELSTNQRVRFHWRIGDALDRSGSQARLAEVSYHLCEGALAGDPLRAIDAARAAADSAVSELAFEEGVAGYERALGVLDLVDGDTDELKLDLQLGRARTLHTAGEAATTEAALQAARLAQRLGEPQRLAEAALVAAMPFATMSAVSDEAVIAVLEAALDAIGPDPGALRARLLAQLAIQLQWTFEKERQREVGIEALRMAEALGEPDVLASVLRAFHAYNDYTASTTVQAQRDNAQKQLAAAEAAGDLSGRCNALQALAVGYFTEGAVDAALGAIADADRLAQQLRQPTLAIGVAWIRVADLHRRGDLPAAEELIWATAARMTELGHPEDRVVGALGGRLFAVRQAQGRIEELEETVTRLVETSPGAPVWRLALAGLLVEANRLDEAWPHLEALTADRCAMIPRDGTFSTTMIGTARCLWRYDEPEVAQMVYDLVLPLEGEIYWEGSALTTPADHALGMVAFSAGRYDDVDRHLANAVRLCHERQVDVHLPRVTVDWARTLLARDEAARARELAESVMEMTEGLDMSGPSGARRRAERVLAGELD